MSSNGLFRQMDTADEVQARLNRRFGPLGRQVTCRFAEGVLELDGRLPSYYHKQLAQETAGQHRGVARVVNRIEVAAPKRRAQGATDRQQHQ